MEVAVLLLRHVNCTGIALGVVRLAARLLVVLVASLNRWVLLAVLLLRQVSCTSETLGIVCRAADLVLLATRHVLVLLAVLLLADFGVARVAFGGVRPAARLRFGPANIWVVLAELFLVLAATRHLLARGGSASKHSSSKVPRPDVVLAVLLLGLASCTSETLSLVLLAAKQTSRLLFERFGPHLRREQKQAEEDKDPRGEAMARSQLHRACFGLGRVGYVGYLSLSRVRSSCLVGVGRQGVFVF